MTSAGAFTEVAAIDYPVVDADARDYGRDRQRQLACVRPSTARIAKFRDGSDGRLIAQAVLPTTGVDAAVEEYERALALGHRGAIVSAFPNGSLDPAPDDDRF